MKKLLIAFFIIALAAEGCKKEDSRPQKLTLSEGVFILNQGNFNVGNSSLSYFEPGTTTRYNNVFSAVNNIPLGDVVHSITIDDELAWIVVNNSGVIQAVHRWTSEVQGKITELGSPRFMLKLSDTKAYVSDLYKSSITIINPSTFEITGEVKVDRSSEEMIKFGPDVFVANWSGYLQSLTNNKVLIIDEQQDKLVDSITVGVEPNSMVLDKNNHLWVLCSGGYDNVEIPGLWKIDAATHLVIDTLFFPELALNPLSLEISAAGDTIFYLNNGIYKMSVNDTKLPDSAFIKEDAGRYFMTLGVDPQNGDLYTTNPLDYQKNGLVYRFDKYGHDIAEMEVGIVPGGFGFNYR